MTKITKRDLDEMLYDGLLKELKKRNFIKEGEEDFGSFSLDMEEIKIDLDELTKIMDTLKQYMVDFDGMNQWWNNVQKRGDK